MGAFTSRTKTTLNWRSDYPTSSPRIQRKKSCREPSSSRSKTLTQIRQNVGEKRQIGTTTRRLERNEKEGSHRRRYA
ncbi:unnamed protein product, partial [Brassica oleracea]